MTYHQTLHCWLDHNLFLLCWSFYKICSLLQKWFICSFWGEKINLPFKGGMFFAIHSFTFFNEIVWNMIHSKGARVKMLIFLELHGTVYPFQYNCAKWFLCGWQHHDSIYFYQSLLHKSTQFHFFSWSFSPVHSNHHNKFSTLFLQRHAGNFF